MKFLQRIRFETLNPNPQHVHGEPPEFPSDLRAFKKLVANFNATSIIKLKTYLCCKKGHTFPIDDAPPYCTYSGLSYAAINKRSARMRDDSKDDSCEVGGGPVCGCKVTTKKVPAVLVVFSIADQLRLILKQERNIKNFKSYIEQMPPEGEAWEDKIFCGIYDGAAFGDFQNSDAMRNCLEDNSELHLYLQCGLDYGQIARWSVGKLGLHLLNITNLPRQRRFRKNRTYVEVLTRTVCVFVLGV